MNYLKYLFRKGMSITTLTEGRDWFESILTIFLSLFKTAEYEAAKSKLRLMKISPDILAAAQENELTNEETVLQIQSEVSTTILSSRFSNFYLPVYTDLKQRLSQDSSNPLNDLYSQQMADMVTNKYMPIIPLWSGMMWKYVLDEELNSHNGFIESKFKTLKYSVLQNRRNLQPTEYIRSYIKYNIGKINELKLIYDTKIRSNNKKRSILQNRIDEGEEQNGYILEEATIDTETQTTTYTNHPEELRSDLQEEINPSDNWWKR